MCCMLISTVSACVIRKLSHRTYRYGLPRASLSNAHHVSSTECQRETLSLDRGGLLEVFCISTSIT